jgi:acetamidase/formamidase
LPSIHRIKLDTYHYKWNKSHKPVLSIKPGDTVTFEINDVSSWQITKDSTVEDLKEMDWSKTYPLAGPVYIEGALPGDSLVVEVKEVKVGDFGWSAIIPGFGLLEEFTEPYLYKWDLKNKRIANFKKGIKIPIRPFCGVLGVTPPERGSFDVMPPGKHGGNMDIRHLTAGSRLELPVWVEGGLFSTGDVHAAMGDGEVCVSAIECPGVATLRFGVKKREHLRWPRYFAKGEGQSRRGYYVATGIAPDLMDATKESVRNMIGYLAKGLGLSKEEAYVLCSVAADLRVHELVDQPNWVVGTTISLDRFPAQRG